MSLSHSIRRALVAGSILALVGGLTGTPTATAAPPVYYTHGGTAYGSLAKLGSLVNSGATSVVSMCTNSATTRTNNAATTNLGVVGSVGAVTTSIQGTNGTTKQTTVATAKTGAVSLLSGLIRANAITSTSTVEHTSAGYKNSGSSTFVGLRIAGVPISATPAKNTSIKLPGGLGTVILNHQVTTNSLGSYRTYTDAMYVKVNSGSTLGLPAGTVVVARADAMLHTPVHTRPYGSAWATEAKLLGGIVGSGQTAKVALPCGGVTGRTLTNSTAAVSVPGVIKTGAVSSSAVSTDSSTETTATTSSKIAGISLLNGAIKVDGLTVRAGAVRKPGKALYRTSNGTTITGLTINGRPVSVSTKENTKIDIAGIGTLWFKKTVRSGTQIQVSGIRLEVLVAQTGVKAGSVITIGQANAGVAAY
jgi:hypothetical protein